MHNASITLQNWNPADAIGHLMRLYGKVFSHSEHKTFIRRPTSDKYLGALSHPSVRIRASSFFNHPETRVFYAAERGLRELGLSNWHVHGQVSYGRIFKSASPAELVDAMGFDPHSAFNSKSADVVIADNLGRPALIIEYQGSGHDPQNDAIKKVVCEKASVCLLPIYPMPVTMGQPLRDVVDIDHAKKLIIEELSKRCKCQSGFYSRNKRSL